MRYPSDQPQDDLRFLDELDRIKNWSGASGSECLWFHRRIHRTFASSSDQSNTAVNEIWNEWNREIRDCSFDFFVDEMNKYAQPTISFLCLEYNHSRRKILRWFTPFIGNQRQSTTQQINIINIFRTIYVSCHLSAASFSIGAIFNHCFWRQQKGSTMKEKNIPRSEIVENQTGVFECSCQDVTRFYRGKGEWENCQTCQNWFALIEGKRNESASAPGWN